MMNMNEDEERGHHWDFGKFFVFVFFLWNNAVSIFFFFSLLIQFAPGCPTAITPSTSNYCISAELDNHREYSHQHLFWSHSETRSHPREHLHMTQSSRFILHVSTVCVCTECVSVDHSSKQNRVGRKKKKEARRVHLCLSNKMGKGFPFGGNTGTQHVHSTPVTPLIIVTHKWLSPQWLPITIKEEKLLEGEWESSLRCSSCLHQGGFHSQCALLICRPWCICSNTVREYRSLRNWCVCVCTTSPLWWRLPQSKDPLFPTHVLRGDKGQTLSIILLLESTEFLLGLAALLTESYITQAPD